MRSATLVGLLYYITAAIFFATVALQLISVFGFDLTSLLPTQIQYSDSGDPEGYFLLPLLGAGALLALMLWLGGRMKRGVILDSKDRAASNLVGIALAYVALNMAYAVIRLHGSHIGLVNGQHVLNTGDGVRILSRTEYHRDRAAFMSYLMSWAMTVFLFLGLAYRQWFREIREMSSRVDN